MSSYESLLAAVRPAGPAPMITMSVSIVILLGVLMKNGPNNLGQNEGKRLVRIFCG